MKRGLNGMRMGPMIVLSTVLGAVVSVATPASARAQAPMPLNIQGTLVIQDGGTNTAVVKYSQATIIGGAETVTVIALSPEHPTLVIRGPSAFAGTCHVAGDCWDGNECREGNETTEGACGWTGTEVAAACASHQNTKPFNDALDACASVRAKARWAGAAFSLLETAVDQCIASGARLQTIAASCPVDRYASGYDLVVEDVLASGQSLMRTSGSNPVLVLGDVRTQLKKIGAWYAIYRSLYPATASEPNPRVVGETSRVLGTFWHIAYGLVGVPVAGTTDPETALLDKLFSRGVEADRVVLEAALTAPAPLEGAPLLELMGDAFNSISTRLQQMGLFHDLACRFRYEPVGKTYGCAKGLVPTEVSELTRYLAAMADPEELASVRGHPKPEGASASWDGWKRVFDGLSSQQSGASPVFQAAVQDALPGVGEYTPGIIAPAIPKADAPLPAATKSSPFLQGFAKIVQDARVRANSYETTGLFGSRYVGMLRGGMTEARVAGTINDIEQKTATLKSSLVTYEQKRMELANSVLAGMTNLANQEHVSNLIRTQLEREQQMRQDLAGLRGSIEVQEARFGDFMRAYEGLLTIVKDRPDTEVHHSGGKVDVIAADATWRETSGPVSETNSLSAIVASPASATVPALTWPLLGKKGEVVTISTEGSWSPNCAIRKERFVNPLTMAEDQAFDVPVEALTGPEGYVMSVSGSTYGATSNSHVHTTDYYENITEASLKACVGTKVGGGTDNPIWNAEVYATLEFCSGYDRGKRHSNAISEGVTSGSESRMAAAFASGIRVSSTPFPYFPAGSLLLLEVARGGTSRSDIRDVHVLQTPYSSIVLSADVDLYLVVNDLEDVNCEPSLSARNLTVSVNVATPVGAMAIELGKAMGTALGKLKASQAQLLEQGRVGPQEMASIQNQAFDDLTAACGTGCVAMSHYPPELLKLFETWVSKELATIERKVDAKTLERQVVLAEMELATLTDDVSRLKEQSRLLSLIPTWTMKDLDTHVVQNQTEGLLTLMLADLYPIIDLRQPDVLKALDQRRLNVLLAREPASISTIPDWPGTAKTLDWTSSMVDVAKAMVSVSEDVIAKMRTQSGPADSDHILAVGIPRPNATIESGNWQRMPLHRAKAVWDAIENVDVKFATVTIVPSDLYQAPSTSATEVLFCGESVPVVTAMAFYLVRPWRTDVFPGLRVPVSVDRNVDFTAVGGTKSYRIDNDEWTQIGVAVLAGEAVIWGADGMYESVQRLTADGATPLYRAAEGLSPFGQFDISLAGLREAEFGIPPIDGAVELVVAFRAKARKAGLLVLDPMCP